MVTIYRGIHDQVAKGVPLNGLFAEALGREGRRQQGQGRSPHISDPASGSMVTTAIVGAGAPIANGLALASKMRGRRPSPSSTSATAPPGSAPCTRR